MRETPLKKRMEVLKLYFEGYPYDEIASKVGIAKGSVVNIIKELRDGRYPEFDSALEIVDELRDLAVRIRKKNISISQATIGLKFYEKLSFVEPSMLESYIRMCEKISPADFPIDKFVNAAISLCKLEEELGKPYDVALKNLQDELRKNSSILKELELRVEELEGRRDRAEKELKGLEEKCKSKRRELEELIKGKESLESLGVDEVSRLSSFAKECEKLEYDVEKLIKLLRLVEERDFLEEEVRSLRKKINALKREKERHSREEARIIENNKKLVNASLIIKTHITSISCASCGLSIPVHIPPPSMLHQELRRGATYSVQCNWCKSLNYISVRDMLVAVGYNILMS